ncbi:MAG: YbaB/EbfC family nucleoid-associated protein [Deltaproteobacteria bacterium]|jgi:hypothetical protein|nr:YbaB/EbfC family nucleoid-associated protein [Deltaproteobacteria bacterium]
MNLNMKEMMRQAQLIQNKIGKLQEELGQRKVEAAVGGGMVKAVANGKSELVSITIERDVVNPDDVEMLQDLVLAAVNEALHRAKEMVEAEMAKATGGMKIPGLF